MGREFQTCLVRGTCEDPGAHQRGLGGRNTGRNQSQGLKSPPYPLTLLGYSLRAFGVPCHPPAGNGQHACSVADCMHQGALLSSFHHLPVPRPCWLRSLCAPRHGGSDSGCWLPAALGGIRHILERQDCRGVKHKDSNCLGRITAPHFPSRGTLGTSFDLFVSQLPHP